MSEQVTRGAMHSRHPRAWAQGADDDDDDDDEIKQNKLDKLSETCTQLNATQM